MEKIFSHAWADKHSGDPRPEQKSDNSSILQNKDGEGLQRKTPIDTTLLVHFFGKKGNVTLRYEEFRR